MTALVQTLPFLLIMLAFSLVASFSPAIGLIAVIGVFGGLFVFARKPFWILLAIVGLVPMDALAKFGDMLSLTKLIFPPLLAIVVWQKVVERKSLWVKQPQRTAVIGFTIAILISFLLAENGEYALLSLKKYASLLMLYWVALMVIARVRDISHLLYVIVITCAISAGVGLLGMLTGIDTGFSGEWEGVARAGGMSSEDPNTFAMNVLVAFFIAGSLLISFKSLLIRSAFILCIITFSLSLVFSFSRSSLVALFLGAAFFFWSRRKEFQWKWVFVFMLIMGVAVAPFIPQEYYDRIATLGDIGTTQDVSLRRRMAYHFIGLDLISKSPIFGVGPGNFPHYFTSQEFRYVADTFGHARRLHNMFLSVASEMGLFGLGCMLVIIATSFKYCNEIIRKARELGMHEHWRNAQALKYSLFTFLAGCVFLPAEYSKYLWIIFACISRMYEIFKEESGAGESSSGKPNT